MKFDKALEKLGVQRGTTAAAIEQRYDRLVAALSEKIDETDAPDQQMKLQAQLMDVVSAMEIVRLTIADDPTALDAPPATEIVEPSPPSDVAEDPEDDGIASASSETHDEPEEDELDILLKKQIQARKDQRGTQFLTELPLKELRQELKKATEEQEEEIAGDTEDADRSDADRPKREVKAKSSPPEVAHESKSETPAKPQRPAENSSGESENTGTAGARPWLIPGLVAGLVAAAATGWWILVGDDSPSPSQASGTSATTETDAISAFLEAQAMLTGQVTTLREARDRAANERLLLEQQLTTLEEGTAALPEAQQQLFADEIASVRSALEQNTQRMSLLEKFVTGGALERASELVGKPPSQIDASMDAALNKLVAQVELTSERVQRARELDQALAARTVFEDHRTHLADYGIEWPPQTQWSDRLDEGSGNPESTLVQANLALAQGRFVDAAGRFGEAADQATSVLAMAETEESLTSDRILALEALAETALEEKRLTSPANDNALLYYQQILAMDPENAFADRGLERIQAAYLQLINASLADNDVDGALSFANKARQVKRGSATMQQIDERIETYYNQLDSRLAEIINEARRLLDEGRLKEFATQVRTLREDYGNTEEADRLEAQRDEVLREPGYRFEEYDGLWMVVVPMGSFEMGYSGRRFLGIGGARNELPRHPVVFEKPVAVAEREITVELFRKFAQANSMETLTASQTNRLFGPQGEMEAPGADWTRDYTGTSTASDDSPVLYVNHSTAQAFARWLTDQTQGAYRLLTESEFEYVLRAGSMTRYPWGDDLPESSVGNLFGANDALPQGWSAITSARQEIGLGGYQDDYFGPAPVASFSPNTLGVHDMVGNVSEWTADCYVNSYEDKGTDGKPVETSNCSQFVVRGSSWRTPAENLRSSFREGFKGESGSNWIGFRVAREL